MEKGEGDDTHDASNDGAGGGGTNQSPSGDALGISRRASLGLDALFGRRQSGFAELEQAMNRRGSMDSTTAVLDSAIMDLTRRRLSMAMGGIPDFMPMSDPFGMNSMGGMMGMAAMGTSNSASTAVNSINARQQQLQDQQRELERRQKELELQRQQLLMSMEERRRVMQHMQTKMGESTSGSGGAAAGGGGASNAAAPAATPVGRNSLLGSLGGGGFGSAGFGSPLAATSMGQSQSATPASKSGAGGGNGGNDWYVCKICNSKAFANKEEAFAHESLCMQSNLGATFQRDARRGSLDLLGAIASSFPSDRRFSAIGESNTSDPQRVMSNGPFTMMEKPLALAMLPDKDWLTPLHCFVRQNCVEIFTATEEDVATPSKGKRKPINVGQIGIRCPHCHNEDSAKSRERGSVYYPTTISSIYNATMNLLQRHLHNCASVPKAIMDRYETLKADDARSGTSKKYWVESARSLGLVDTPSGIRFSALPPPPLPTLTPQQKSSDGFSAARGNDDDFFNTSSNALSNLSQRGEVDGSATKDAPKAPSEQSKNAAGSAGTAPKEGGNIPESEQSLTDSAPLVTAEDEPFATGFSYHLLSQMQPCVFTEADRLGKRKGLPPGFPGLACRHCFGGYGSGRFFPSSIKTLSDTSKTLNVLHNHMQRCRKCPPEVRETLDKLRKFHDEQRSKMKFGSQKAFFARIWDRLHSNDPTVNSKRKFEQPVRNQPASGMTGMSNHNMSFPSMSAAAAHLQQPGAFMGGMGGMGGGGFSGGFAGFSGLPGGFGGGMPFDSALAMQYASGMQGGINDENKRRKLNQDQNASV
ncbi:MAG: hypothetical protein SGILL_000327 [Bacillariaceae sp.]